jgi:hypothetical protein
VKKYNILKWFSAVLLFCFVIIFLIKIEQMRSVKFVSFAEKSLQVVADELNLIFSETDSLYAALLPLLRRNANNEEINEFFETKNETLFAEKIYVIGQDEILETEHEWIKELIEESHGESLWGGPVFDSVLGKRVAYRLIFCNISKKNIIFIYSSQRIFNKLLQTEVSRFGIPYIMNDLTFFIAHPLGETRSLLQLGHDNNNDVLVRLSEQVIQGKPLDKNYWHINTITKQISTEILIKLDTTGWFLGFVTYDGKALESAEYQMTLRRYCITLVFSIGIFFILLWYNIFNRGKIIRFNVLVYPIILFAMLIGIISAYNYYPLQSRDNIGTRNYIEHTHDGAHPQDIHPKWDMRRLISKNSLQAFIDGYQAESKILYGELAKLIPTGSYFYSGDFINSYTVRVTGTLWQKFLILDEDYPQEMIDIYHFEDFEQKGVFFTGAYINSIEQTDVTETMIGDYPARLFRWNFDIESVQKLSYSLYPFGKNSLELIFSTNDFDNNVILIPDLDGYLQLYPTAKLGIDSKFHLKSWDIYLTYYSYVMESYLSNFGNVDIQGINQFPELIFNISIMRKFGDILIGKVIPLIIVLLLLFTILFVRDRSDGFNNIIGCSGLFFVVIIDHINLRESVAPEEIMFLEYAYFLSYALLLFVATTSFDIFKRGEEFGIKADSIIRKYFWTFVIGIITVITAFRFW